MAVNVSKLVGAGVAYVDYGIIDSTGYLQGSAITAPAAGDQDGSSTARLQGASNFPWQPSAAQNASVEADDGAIAQFMFFPADLPSSEPIFRAADYDFDAIAMTLLTQDIGGGTFIPRQPGEPSYRDIVWLVVTQAKTLLDGATAEGLTHWEGLLIHNTNVQALGRTARQTATVNADYGYTLTSSYASQYPWGLAFSEVLNGTTKMAASDFSWPYKPKMQRWTGDNVETDFNLGFDIAEDSATNIVVYVDGVAQTWVTGVPGAGEFGVTEAAGATDTLVLGTAPGTDAKLVALYGVTSI